jgi:UDP-2,3-diacylglucosamine hydrolase
MPQAAKLQHPAASARELGAAASWTMIDVLSDTHLDELAPANFVAWRRHMETTPAQAVFILGDWFEVWVGDDAAPSAHSVPNRHDGLIFEDRVARTMRHAAERLSLHVMAGNRDFLLGADYLALCHAQALDDPTVLIYGPSAEQRVLLTHGDLLCTDDTAYLGFRAQVRDSAWQKDFLAKPLAERREIANNLRKQSMQAQQARKQAVDVNPQACDEWLKAARAQTLIHGHTHTGSTHPCGESGKRWVTADWHASEGRAEVLRLHRQASGAPLIERIRLGG